MVDKNKNGIDDYYEVSYGRRTPGDTTSKSVVGAPKRPEGIAGAWQDFLQGPVRGFANFAGDLGNFFASKPVTPGQSAGDQMFGVPNRSRTAAPRRGTGQGGGSFGPPVPPPGPETSPAQRKGLLEFLSEAGPIVDQLGIGGGGPDYSGAMQNARDTQQRNSAYLTAIYNQLRGGMQEDRGKITENTQGSIDRSQQIAREAQQGTQQAYDSAAAAQAQEANALGMQSAQASINTERPGLQAQAAQAIEDSNARAQNAQTLYNTQGDNALRHNQNVQDASRFSETRSQADLNASLADRLAELSTLQAQANAEGQSRRASAIQSLGQYLYENQNSMDQQDFENQLRVLGIQQEADIARQKAQGQQGYTLADLMRSQAESGLNQQDFINYMKLVNGQ